MALPIQLWFEVIKEVQVTAQPMCFGQSFTAQLSCQTDSSFPSLELVYRRGISSYQSWDQRILRKEQHELLMHPSCPLEDLGSWHWMHCLLLAVACSCCALLVVTDTPTLHTTHWRTKIRLMKLGKIVARSLFILKSARSNKKKRTKWTVVVPGETKTSQTSQLLEVDQV